MHLGRTSARVFGALGVFAALSASCSSSHEATITLVTGDEADVFSRDPRPTTLVVERIATDGTRGELTRTALPADQLSLGDLERAQAGALAVSGLTADGKTVVRGESLYVQWGALEEAALEIFVQRTGELARLPRGPGAFTPVQSTVIAGRYVFMVSGTASIVYDLLNLKVLSTPPALPRQALSLANYGIFVTIIDSEGATGLDLSSGANAALTAPAGGTYAEIAGGSTVTANDGSQYVVGATRSTGGATPRILKLDKDGNLTFVALTHAREGACAAWVEGRGLVVYGGDAKAPGAEVLSPDATVAAPLALPPDAVRGCGAATLDGSHVVVAGGTGAAGDTGKGLPPRVVDIACTAECKPAAWQGSPLALVRTQALALSPEIVFVVGDDAAQVTHAYRATRDGLREVPLKTERRGAQLIAMPIGAAGIVGGNAGIEQYLE